jgi:hypothetical protein
MGHSHKTDASLRLHAALSLVPQENGAEKKAKTKCLIYMLAGIACGTVRSPTVPSLEHGLSSPATRRTEACDDAAVCITSDLPVRPVLFNGLRRSNQYRRFLIHPFVQVATAGHGGGRLRRHKKKRLPCLLLHQNAISGPKGREGAVAPLGANQDAKTTNGSGESLGETAAMENHPAPLTAGNMFARLAGIGVLLLGVVGAFLFWAGGSARRN